MNFNFFVRSGFIGLILLFVIQVLGIIRGLLIQSGFMDGSIDQTLLGTKLIIVPIIFFTISVIFFLLWFYKDYQKSRFPNYEIDFFMLIKPTFYTIRNVITHACKERTYCLGGKHEPVCLFNVAGS